MRPKTKQSDPKVITTRQYIGWWNVAVERRENAVLVQLRKHLLVLIALPPCAEKDKSDTQYKYLKFVHNSNCSLSLFNAALLTQL